MRVHELAKTLEMQSGDLIKELKRARILVKNHMSALEDKHVRKVMLRIDQTREKAEKKRIEQEKFKAEQDRVAAIKRKKEEERKIEEERKAEILRRQEAIKKTKEDEKKRKQEEKEKKAAQKKRKAGAAKKKAATQKEEETETKRKRTQADKSADIAVAEKKPKKTTRSPKTKEIAETKGTRDKSKQTGRDKPLRPRVRSVGASLGTFKQVGEQQTFILEKTFKRQPVSSAKKKERRFKPTKIFVKGDVNQQKPKRKLKKRPEPAGSPVAQVSSTQTSATSVLEPASAEVKPEQLTPLTIRGELTVAEFSEKLGVPASEVITKALLLGMPVTINQFIDFDLAEIIASDYNFELEIIPETDEYDVREYLIDDKNAKLEARPPVVTIMGHVDHGKTSLLDRIRKSDVVSGESGGITQHIGAYYVHTPKGEIVFLDTPGHEAFTAMRARGALFTDLVVIVVAANDSVKPQTIEAINHSKDANLPIIVAINKMDLPGADPDKVKQDLLQHEIISEELGGETIFVETSAKENTGIDKLLEMILLQSEVMELSSPFNRPAVGAIIESRIDSLRGVVATVLIQKGTLKVGECFVAGTQDGKVRAMINDKGEPVKIATPAHPVEIIGISGPPLAGDTFVVVPSEKKAHQIATIRAERRRKYGLYRTPHISLENLHERIEEGKIKEVKVVLKGDVQGSLEAIIQSFEKIPRDKVKVKIIHSAVGGVNESDVNLAAAADAVVLGFHVRAETSASLLAEQEQVEIKIYHVIYHLLDDIKKSLMGLLDPLYKEIPVGKATVRKTFKVSRTGTIAGCYVDEGEMTRGSNIRLYRDNLEIYDGKVESLRRLKDDVAKVSSDTECGIRLEKYNDIKEGDILEAYRMEEIPQEL